MLKFDGGIPIEGIGSPGTTGAGPIGICAAAMFAAALAASGTGAAVGIATAGCACIGAVGVIGIGVPLVDGMPDGIPAGIPAGVLFIGMGVFVTGIGCCAAGLTPKPAAIVGEADGADGGSGIGYVGNACLSRTYSWYPAGDRILNIVMSCLMISSSDGISMKLFGLFMS